MRVLCAPDKFRGTLSAAQAAAAMADGARVAGWSPDLAPISDGGEGFVDCLPGTVHTATVEGPVGTPVTAAFRLDGDVAYLEMATVAGRSLLRDPTPEQVLAASTFGVGQLIGTVVSLGATTVIVGCGGSATTDGGLGCLEALSDIELSDSVKLIAAVDVWIPFRAALGFAPQKGATPSQMSALDARLAHAELIINRRAGRGLSHEPGTGSAGGLAGALASLGAEIQSGFAMVAAHTELTARAACADLIITGEGRFDRESLSGKAPGALLAALSHARQLALCCGVVDADAARMLRGSPFARPVLISSLDRRERRAQSPEDAATALRSATAHLCALAALHC